MADFSRTPMHTAAIVTADGPALNVRDAKSVTICVESVGGGTGTVTFEGSCDPDPATTLWFGVAMRATTQTNSTTLVLTATAAGAFVLPQDHALAQIRARFTYATGTGFTVVCLRKSN